MWECLFGNLVPFSDASREAHFLPWKILESSEELKMTKYLSRACGIWAKEGQLKANMIMVLKTHVHTENNDLAWLLLSLISGHVSIADPHFVMEYFNTSIHTPEGVWMYFYFIQTSNQRRFYLCSKFRWACTRFNRCCVSFSRR